MNRWKWICLAAAVLVCFLAGVAVKIGAPLTFWDSALVRWASTSSFVEAPARTSPFYLVLLKALAAARWLEVSHLRWLNAAAAIMTALVTFRLAARLWQCTGAGILAASLYLLHPSTIQGTQSLDGADSSFFPLAFTLWILEFVSARPGRWTRAALLGLWGGWAMGWKMTSSLGLLLFPLAALLLRARNGNHGTRDHATRSLFDMLALLAGFAAFAISWGTLQQWSGPHIAVESALFDVTLRAGSATLPGILFHSALAAAWLGPFFLVLASWGGVSLFRQSGARLRGALAATVLYSLSYLVVGGMNHAFPRYHAAVLPFLCAACALPASFQSWNRARSLAVLLLAGAFWAFAGDPIHLLNVQAREARLAGSLVPAAAPGVLLLWLGVPVAVKFAFSIPWRQMLLPAALAGCLALGIVQSRAPYVTAYGYGEQGRKQVLDWVEKAAPAGGSVLSPPNVSAGLWSRGIRGPSHAPWKSRESVLDWVGRNDPAAMVLSLTENSDWQLQWLLREPPPPLDACRGRYSRIGTYWVCELRR